MVCVCDCVCVWGGGGGGVPILKQKYKSRNWHSAQNNTFISVFDADAVSSIYIWSKNFSHSVYVKSEAKDGGH